MAVDVVSGRLTYECFRTCATQFVARSNRLGGGWDMRTAVLGREGDEQALVYLVKTHTQSRILKAETKNDDSTTSPVQTDHLLEVNDGIEDTDPAILLPSDKESGSNAKPTIINMEYHVVYSVSYEVPMLYFQATYENGKRLSLNQVWELVAPSFPLNGTQWDLITQQEHPILNRPFYCIHPCRTAKVMHAALSCTCTEKPSTSRVEASSNQDLCKEVVSDGVLDSEAPNYLVTWLSTFGSIIGLTVPLEYACKPSSE